MFQKTIISPSILSADLANLGKEIRAVENAGAGAIHIDVMDGHFVDNLSFGFPIIEATRKLTDLDLDVHLMIDNPILHAQRYLDAGADFLTVHAEACSVDELTRFARIVHTVKKKAGVAIRPSTSTEVLDDVIEAFDMVLVMSVEPGFSGQAFKSKAIDLMAQVAAIAAAHNVEPRMQADGGIGVGTAQKVAASGADVLVCGNAIFKNDDYSKVISAIKVDAELGRTAGLKKMEAIAQFL